jgi:hypothetical protein
VPTHYLVHPIVEINGEVTDAAKVMMPGFLDDFVQRLA